jgi:hypothetical protein
MTGILEWVDGSPTPPPGIRYWSKFAHIRATCGGCDQIAVSHTSLDVARQWLQGQGWKVQDDTVLCPSCVAAA